MPNETVEQFFNQAEENELLMQRLDDCTTLEEVVTIALEEGFSFSTEELTEMSDDDLDSVAGGISDEPSFTPKPELSISDEPSFTPKPELSISDEPSFTPKPLRHRFGRGSWTKGLKF